ncbi:hypothetical protein V6N11_059737 [Hibiscus sabdariffa]|uniref:Uncharacterized protein n=1 Tax=Hibiscus sabdariffa TaxID=183260 RepID=A0ABR2NY59_9ROSI
MEHFSYPMKLVVRSWSTLPECDQTSLGWEYSIKPLSEHMKCSLYCRRLVELEIDLLALLPNKFLRGLIEVMR